MRPVGQSPTRSAASASISTDASLSSVPSTSSIDDSTLKVVSVPSSANQTQQMGNIDLPANDDRSVSSEQVVATEPQVPVSTPEAGRFRNLAPRPYCNPVLEDLLRIASRRLRTETYQTPQSSWIHFRTCHSLFEELFDKIDIPLCRDEKGNSFPADLAGSGQFRFLDIACAPGGFSQFLLEGAGGRGECIHGYGLTLPEELGGFPILINRHSRVPYEVCYFDLLSHPATPLPVSGDLVDLAVADAQYLPGKQFSQSPYRGSQFRDINIAKVALLTNQIRLAFEAIREGGTFVFRFSAYTRIPENSYRLLMLCVDLFNTVSPFKSEYVHCVDTSFYLVCRGFKRTQVGQQIIPTMMLHCSYLTRADGVRAPLPPPPRSLTVISAHRPRSTPTSNLSRATSQSLSTEQQAQQQPVASPFFVCDGSSNNLRYPPQPFHNASPSLVDRKPMSASPETTPSSILSSVPQNHATLPQDPSCFSPLEQQPPVPRNHAEPFTKPWNDSNFPSKTTKQGPNNCFVSDSSLSFSDNVIIASKGASYCSSNETFGVQEAYSHCQQPVLVHTVPLRGDPSLSNPPKTTSACVLASPDMTRKQGTPQLSVQGYAEPRSEPCGFSHRHDRTASLAHSGLNDSHGSATTNAVQQQQSKFEYDSGVQSEDEKTTRGGEQLLVASTSFNHHGAARHKLPRRSNETSRVSRHRGPGNNNQNRHNHATTATTAPPPTPRPPTLDPESFPTLDEVAHSLRTKHSTGIGRQARQCLKRLSQLPVKSTTTLQVLRPPPSTPSCKADDQQQRQEQPTHQHNHHHQQQQQPQHHHRHHHHHHPHHRPLSVSPPKKQLPPSASTAMSGRLMRRTNNSSSEQQSRRLQRHNTSPRHQNERAACAGLSESKRTQKPDEEPFNSLESKECVSSDPGVVSSEHQPGLHDARLRHLVSVEPLRSHEPAVLPELYPKVSVSSKYFDAWIDMLDYVWKWIAIGESNAVLAWRATHGPRLAAAAAARTGGCRVRHRAPESTLKEGSDGGTRQESSTFNVKENDQPPPPPPPPPAVEHLRDVVCPPQVDCQVHNTDTTE